MTRPDHGHSYARKLFHFTGVLGPWHSHSAYVRRDFDAIEDGIFTSVK
jgi:hypothetical protein